MIQYEKEDKLIARILCPVLLFYTQRTTCRQWTCYNNVHTILASLNNFSACHKVNVMWWVSCIIPFAVTWWANGKWMCTGHHFKEFCAFYWYYILLYLCNVYFVSILTGNLPYQYVNKKWLTCIHIYMWNAFIIVTSIKSLSLVQTKPNTELNFLF